jgi:hypothetical protein
VNKKAALPFIMATRLSCIRSVAFRPYLAAGLAFAIFLEILIIRDGKKYKVANLSIGKNTRMSTMVKLLFGFVTVFSNDLGIYENHY